MFCLVGDRYRIAGPVVKEKLVSQCVVTTSGSVHNSIVVIGACLLVLIWGVECTRKECLSKPPPILFRAQQPDCYLYSTES